MILLAVSFYIIIHENAQPRYQVISTRKRQVTRMVHRNESNVDTRRMIQQRLHPHPPQSHLSHSSDFTKQVLTEMADDAPAASSFDTTEGFRVTNNTLQTVFLQVSANSFEIIRAGSTSMPHRAYRSYPLRVSNSTNAAIYLTIVVDAADGSFRVDPSARRGRFAVTSNFV
ncbi:hypothetical protein BJV77DRAFT_434449 [Russula vinacea]|nr:hypothetical protein BJV77DRAFT_434449 [Russula vinacea]